MAPHKGVFREIEAKSGAFALVFLLLFGLTFGFLALVGATPEAPGTAGVDLDIDTSPSPTPIYTPTGSPTPPSAGQKPTRIVIKKIGVDASVLNPSSTNVDILDRELLKGAVRYPTSGLLGQNGTVLLFGHSSYLPVIHNPAYKAFSHIQDLKKEDVVSVYSGGVEYRFAVTGVFRADATTDVVELPQDGQYLTLVTCDTFSSKSNRFIVTAKLVGSY